MKISDNFVNVSHGIGIPFGGIGTGYGVFGKYGFVMPNFDSTPNKEKYEGIGALRCYDYLDLHGNDTKNFWTVTINAGGKTYAVQQTRYVEDDMITADELASYAYLPFGIHKAAFKEAGISVEILMYSPMIPYDLKESSIPAMCMELKLTNSGVEALSGTLQLWKDNKYIRKTQMKTAFDGGSAEVEFELGAGETVVERAVMAWYYPDFVTPSPHCTENYKRYYTLRFHSVDEVAEYAFKHMDSWKTKMQKWQDSFDVPVPLKKMWFSSISSIITSTMLSADPRFFEIESPHKFVNTMDVTIYSSWIYMINWPEIEKMDMYEFFDCIPKEGKNKGLVWHSLWDDAAHYVEEPCFITRIYRDYLWYNDKEFLKDAAPVLENALNRVFADEYDSLIESKHGNQSYDVWKMPGVSTYVNMPWLFALYSVLKVNQITGAGIQLEKRKVEEVFETAKKKFVDYLWNEEYGYFNCFYRTENAASYSVPDAVFTDQIFGYWLMLLEKESQEVVPIEKLRKSVEYIYENNLVEDTANEFRGWVNGMLPGGIPYYEKAQRHGRTCWLGAQLDLASVLGDLGYEEQSLDVFYTVEKSLKNNHLAVGEWNRSITQEGISERHPEEPSKDTARFPAYPRYKCCWEYLIRILGLKVDEEQMELKPFKSIDFAITDIVLAECHLTIKVKRGWKEIYIDGQNCEKAVFDRKGTHEIIFR